MLAILNTFLIFLQNFPPKLNFWKHLKRKIDNAVAIHPITLHAEKMAVIVISST